MEYVVLSEKKFKFACCVLSYKACECTYYMERVSRISLLYKDVKTPYRANPKENGYWIYTSFNSTSSVCNIEYNLLIKERILIQIHLIYPYLWLKYTLFFIRDIYLNIFCFLLENDVIIQIN